MQPTLVSLCAVALMVQIGLGKRRLRWRTIPVRRRRPPRASKRVER